MKDNIDSGTIAALGNARAKGLVIRDLITVYARNRMDNSITPFSFWKEPDNVTVAGVQSGIDGTINSRTYIGGGSLLSVGTVPNVADLTIRRVPLSVSQLHPTVQEMVRTYDVRVCAAEIHRALLDPATNLLVGNVYCHFVGQVNTSPFSTPAVRQQGGIALEIVSDTRELTRFNPAKRSDNTAQLRSGDRINRYASLGANIQLFWGENTVGPQQ